MKKNFKISPLYIITIVITALGLLGVISYLFWDQNILTWQRANLADLDTPFIFSGLAQLGKTWLLVWLLCCWALLAKCHTKAGIALLAICLVTSIVLPTKAATHRLRPRAVMKIEQGGQPKRMNTIFHSSSFPSGDAASVFAVATAILPFITPLMRLTAFSLASCVALLRVFSFSHYLSDVFMGAAVGILAGYAAYHLFTSRSALREFSANLLTPRNLFLTLIIIPITITMSKGADDLFIFMVFYPPMVAALYWFAKWKKNSNFRQKEPQTAENFDPRP